MMKNTYIILLAIIFVFVSCEKDETDSSTTDPNDTTENSSVLWEYEIDQFNVLLTDIVLDDSDNSYFFARANDEYFLYSLDNAGALRWSKTIAFGSYLNSGIMLAGDKLILSYQYDVVAAYNLSDGSEIWSTTLSVGYSDMAYNNGIVYVAQSATSNNESNISALDANTGSVKWDYFMDKHIDTKISVDQDQICVVSDDQLPWPYEIALTVLTDNGSDATLAWNISKPHVYMESEAKARRAIFDGLGNIYFEEDVTDTTYIHSYNAANGTENWETKLCNWGLPEPVILFGNGIVTASYKSSEQWAIVNSIASINATTGEIIKKNEEIISNDAQVLLTSNNSTVVFNRLLDDQPTMQIYDSYGDLTSSMSASFLGWFVTSFNDCRITSEGNLIYLNDETVICADAKLTQANSGTWSCKKGTNGNTNSIN
jgi:outer membrane protein assembly factor BamB